MATDSRTFTTQRNAASNADLQAWVAALIAAFTAAGLTQTTDTGQITAATATVPTNAMASLGYLMFKFSDAAQSTYPVFIKVEPAFSCGYNSTGTYNPGYWVTVGTATDGAGNITGAAKSARRFCGSSANTNASGGYTATMLTSGDGSRISTMAGLTAIGSASPGILQQAGFAAYNGVANSDFGFSVERDRDSSGNVTGDGASVMWHTAIYDPMTGNYAGSTAQSPSGEGVNPLYDLQYVPNSGLVPQSSGVACTYYGSGNGMASSSIANGQSTPNGGTGSTGNSSECFGSLIPMLKWQGGGGATQVWGTNVGLNPVFPWNGGFRNPLLCIAGYCGKDLAMWSVFTASIAGVNHTYIATPCYCFNNYGQPGFTYNGPSTAYVSGYDMMAMRWD